MEETYLPNIELPKFEDDPWFCQHYPVKLLLIRFIGLEPGTRVSRAEAQHAVCEYIRINKLANPDCRPMINLDQTLKTLLRSEGPLTYSEIVENMQWLFPSNLR
jgi:hypothetical protein